MNWIRCLSLSVLLQAVYRLYNSKHTACFYFSYLLTISYQPETTINTKNTCNLEKLEFFCLFLHFCYSVLFHFYPETTINTKNTYNLEKRKFFFLFLYFCYSVLFHFMLFFNLYFWHDMCIIYKTDVKFYLYKYLKYFNVNLNFGV